MSAWTTDDKDADDRCEHCDNCKRPPESWTPKSVSLESWIILKIMERIASQQGQITMSKLITLSRNGGGFSVARGKRKRGQAEAEENIDLQELVGGKVTLSPAVSFDM